MFSATQVYTGKGLRFDLCLDYVVLTVSIEGGADTVR